MPRLTVNERLAEIKRSQVQSEPTPDVDPRVQEIADRRAELNELLDKEILAVSAGIHSATSTFAPRSFLPQPALALVDELRMSDMELRKRFAIVLTRAQWQAKAGTAGDLKLAEQGSADADAAYEEQAPEIKSKIGALERELCALDRGRTDARLRLNEMLDARQKLRDIARTDPAIGPEHARRKSRISPLQHELSEAQSRRAGIQEIAGLDVSLPDGKRKARDLARSWRPEVAVNKFNDAEQYIHIELWRKLVLDLNDEIPALEQRCAELESQIKIETAEIDTLLDFYVG